MKQAKCVSRAKVQAARAMLVANARGYYGGLVEEEERERGEQSEEQAVKWFQKWFAA